MKAAEYTTITQESAAAGAGAGNGAGQAPQILAFPAVAAAGAAAVQPIPGFPTSDVNLLRLMHDLLKIVDQSPISQDGRQNIGAEIWLLIEINSAVLDGFGSIAKELRYALGLALPGGKQFATEAVAIPAPSMWKALREYRDKFQTMLSLKANPIQRNLLIELFRKAAAADMPVAAATAFTEYKHLFEEGAAARLHSLLTSANPDDRLVAINALFLLSNRKLKISNYLYFREVIQDIRELAGMEDNFWQWLGNAVPNMHRFKIEDIRKSHLSTPLDVLISNQMPLCQIIDSAKHNPDAIANLKDTDIYKIMLHPQVIEILNFIKGRTVQVQKMDPEVIACLIDNVVKLNDTGLIADLIESSVTNENRQSIIAALSKSRDPAIAYAIRINNLDMFKKLCELIPLQTTYHGNPVFSALYFAARESNARIAKELLNQGAAIKFTESQIDVALAYAARSGSIEVFNLLKDRRTANFFRLKFDRGNILMTVLSSLNLAGDPRADKYKEVILALIDIYPVEELNIKDARGWTAYNYAKNAGNQVVMEALKAKGAKLDEPPVTVLVAPPAPAVAPVVPVAAAAAAAVPQDLGRTPLMQEIIKKNHNISDIIKIIEGLDPSKVDEKDKEGRTALDYIIDGYHPPEQIGSKPFVREFVDRVRITQALLEKGADINKCKCVPLEIFLRFYGEEESLEPAQQQKYIEFFIELVNRTDHSRINLASSIGSLLDHSVMQNLDSVTEALINKGADFNAKYCSANMYNKHIRDSARGERTVLMRLLEVGKIELAKRIIEQKLRPEDVNLKFNGYTLLYDAFTGRGVVRHDARKVALYDEVIDNLLVKINLPDKELFEQAIKGDRADIVEKILDRNQGYISSSGRGEIPTLVSAVQSRSVKTVRMLLDRGAYTEEPYKGKTAFVWLAQHPQDYAVIAKDLVLAGANVNIRYKNDAGIVKPLWLLACEEVAMKADSKVVLPVSEYNFVKFLLAVPGIEITDADLNFFREKFKNKSPHYGKIPKEILETVENTQRLIEQLKTKLEQKLPERFRGVLTFGIKYIQGIRDCVPVFGVREDKEDEFRQMLEDKGLSDLLQLDLPAPAAAEDKGERQAPLAEIEITKMGIASKVNVRKLLLALSAVKEELAAAAPGAIVKVEKQEKKRGAQETGAEAAAAADGAAAGAAAAGSADDANTTASKRRKREEQRPQQRQGASAAADGAAAGAAAAGSADDANTTASKRRKREEQRPQQRQGASAAAAAPSAPSARHAPVESHTAGVMLTRSAAREQRR